MVHAIRRLALAELLFFAAVAIVVTWPVAWRIDRVVPLGTEKSATVPLLNVWTVWWNADRARNLYDGYWDAPIFYPTEKTFAMSETQPLTVTAAPVLWTTSSRVAAYNIYLLLILTLNGWSAFHLLRQVKLNWFPALLGGLLVQVLPFVHWKLGLIQCVPLCGIIWTIHALCCFGDKPSWIRGALIGIAFASTYHFCNYYGLFWSALLVVSAGWLLGRRVLEWRAWLMLLPAALVAIAIVYPFAHVQRKVAREHDWEREIDIVARLSADIRDYSVEPVSRLNWPDVADPDRRERWPLGAGYLYYVLGAIGIAAGVADRTKRCWALFCLTLLIASVLLSLGPDWRVGGWSPYRFLVDHYPGFRFVRSPYRFAVFAQLAVAISAGTGLHYVAIFSSRWRLKRVLPIATTLILGGAAAVSIWPRAPKLFSIPSYEQNERWVSWVRDNTPAESAVVCVPFVRGTSAAKFEETAVWMYWGTYHRRSLANGYSGYFPASFFRLRNKMASFPDSESLDCLVEYGIDYVIIRRSTRRSVSPSRWPTNLRRVFRDHRARMDIYEIVTLPRANHTESFR